MSARDDLYQRVLGFLLEECRRQGGRMCVRIELNHAQKGYRADSLKEWHREDDPLLFEDGPEQIGRIEELTSTIIRRAEEEADSFGSGMHRFQIITHQHLGGRMPLSFSIAASYSHEDGDLALTVQGGDGSPDGGGPYRGRGAAPNELIPALNLQMRHNVQLMNINGQMFQGSLAVLAKTNEQLRTELTEANKTIRELTAQLNEANDKSEDRALALAKQQAADARKDKVIAKGLPFIPIVAAKMLGGGKDKDGKPNGTAQDQQTGLQILMTELAKSLSPAQIMKMSAPMDMNQKILFLEAWNMIKGMQPDEDSDEASGGDSKKSEPTNAPAPAPTTEPSQPKAG